MLIRPATLTDATAVATVQLATWQSAYSGIIPHAYLQRLDAERVSRRWRAMLALPRTTVWLAEQRPHQAVAQADGSPASDRLAPWIVGFAAAGPEMEGDPEFQACLQGLYVLPEVQGRGIGGLLLRTAVDHLVREGYANLILWVLDANPVTSYYERLGGKPVRARVARIGGARLPVTGHGWAWPRLRSPPGARPTAGWYRNSSLTPWTIHA